MREHGQDIENDAADSLAALYGTIVHKILDEADDESQAIREKRLEFVVDGKRISGQFDRFLLAEGRLQDYKFTSVWAHAFGPREDYIAQQNVYAAILRANGFIVNASELIYIFRDWSKSKARYDQNHPDSPVKTVELTLWPQEKTIEHIRQRIELYDDLDQLCTSDDRWAKPDTWAVQKPGLKRASKVENSLADAEAWALENIDRLKEYSIEHRPGANTRCRDYCDVASVCTQWASIQEDLARVDQGEL